MNQDASKTLAPETGSDKPALSHVVIVGGGFGGLYAAKALANKAVRVTLVDKRNFHLFQPLLYQIAIGELSPGEIASPLRSILRNAANITVRMDEMTGFDPEAKQIILRDEPEPLAYDMLVLAAGGMTHYFGHDDWAAHANGLKTLEDALDMRRRIFNAFETAERERDPQKRAALLNFVVVGGGPTGVELAGALAELTRLGLQSDFRNIDPEQAQIIMIEAAPRILGPYHEELSQKAADTLAHLGVTVRTGVSVTDINDHCITLSEGDRTERIEAGTILWAAGVKASPLGRLIAEKTGVEADRGGRVPVQADCSVAGYPDVFVIGDLANYSATPSGKPLPGVAPVAIQQGQYVGRLILARQQGWPVQPFQYEDKGSLAVIGLNQAVADLGPALGNLRLSGFSAWLIWAFVHILYLIAFNNKLLVMFQWLWTFLTRRTSARLITGRQAYD